jgi:hypothetical protein
MKIPVSSFYQNGRIDSHVIVQVEKSSKKSGIEIDRKEEQGTETAFL